MIYLKLFLVFFKIGCFSFGGGYAALPLIERELVTGHQWLTAAEFSKLVPISQMTPGPIGISSSTFAGYIKAGIPGSLAATVGLCLPSLIILFVLFRLLKKFSEKEESLVRDIFLGMRPVVVALVAAAVFSVGKGGFSGWSSCLIAAVSFGLAILSPKSLIPIIAVFGLVGILLY